MVWIALRALSVTGYVSKLKSSTTYLNIRQQLDMFFVSEFGFGKNKNGKIMETYGDGVT